MLFLTSKTFFMYSENSDWILSKLFFIATMLCDSWFSSIKGLGRDGLKHTLLRLRAHCRVDYRTEAPFWIYIVLLLLVAILNFLSI